MAFSEFYILCNVTKVPRIENFKMKNKIHTIEDNTVAKSNYSVST